MCKCANTSCDHTLTTIGTGFRRIVFTVKALYLFEAACPVAIYIWKHWTTSGIISSAVECANQLPKLVDDMIAFREDHGNFPLSEDALKYLELFPGAHRWQVPILSTSRTPVQTLTRFTGARSACYTTSGILGKFGSCTFGPGTLAKCSTHTLHRCGSLNTRWM